MGTHETFTAGETRAETSVYAGAATGAEVSVRGFVKWGLTALALSVAAVPAVLVLALGWQHTVLLGDPLGPGSGAAIVMVLFYTLWLPGIVIALIWASDRLGLHYAVPPQRPSTTRKERRRQRAGLELLASQERARQEAERECRSHDRSPALEPSAPAGARLSDQALSEGGEWALAGGPRRERPFAGVDADRPDVRRMPEER